MYLFNLIEMETNLCYFRECWNEKRSWYLCVSRSPHPVNWNSGRWNIHTDRQRIAEYARMLRKGDKEAVDFFISCIVIVKRLGINPKTCTDFRRKLLRYFVGAM